MSLVFSHLALRVLRQDARRVGLHRFRCLWAAALTVVFLWALTAPQWQLTMDQRGHLAFVSVTALGTAMCALSGLRHMAEWPVDQWHDGTRELLLHTSVRGMDWVISGFIAKGLQAMYDLIPVLPLLVFSWNMGGASVPECGRILLVMAITVFFSCSAGLLGAAAGDDERQVLMATVSALLVAMIWIPLAGIVWASLHPTVHGWLWGGAFSPIFTFHYALEENYGHDAMLFYGSILLQFLLAVAVFASASRRLARHAASVETPSRAHKIQVNSRFAYPLLPAWLLLGVVPAIVIALGLRNRMALGYTFIALYSLHLCLKIFMGLEATCRIRGERRVGMLALERATGRTAEEVSTRLYAALRSKFLAPVVLLALGNAGVLLAVLLSNALPVEEKLFLSAILLAGVAELVADGQALLWQGLASGCNYSHASTALSGAVAKTVLLSWMIIWGFYTMYQGGFLAESEMVAFFVCRAAMGVGLSVALGRAARNRLHFAPHAINLWHP